MTINPINHHAHWHGFTQMAAYEPLVIDRAEGMVGPPARMDADSPRDRISPVSPQETAGRQTLQTEALVGPAVNREIRRRQSTPGAYFDPVPLDTVRQGANARERTV